MKIILGSQSAYRQKHLADFGYQFEVHAPDVDEKAIRYTDPMKLTVAIAREKRRALVDTFTDIQEPTILITADTVLASGGHIMEKPTDADDARRMFEVYKTNPLHAVTAVAGARLDTGTQKDGFAITSFRFVGLTPDVIEKLIAREYAPHCAGGFTFFDAETMGLVQDVDGELETVTGMPKSLTQYLIFSLSA